MAVDLVITFDGPTPGIEAQTLSLSEFGEAIHKLLNAIRESASRMVVAKVPPSSIGCVGEVVDLRLREFDSGSLKLTFAVAVTCVSPLLGQNDERDIVVRFINDVQSYANGELDEPRMRNYMCKIPRGVTQRYEGFADGKSLGSVEIDEEMAIARERPSLRRVVGHVKAIRVLEGKETVSINELNGASITCLANASLVELAFQLRKDEIEAVILFRPEANRLLSIGQKGSFRPKTPEERLAFTLQKWDGTLKKLAE